MSLACGCQLERARQPHVALALRAAALDSMPRLWDAMADFFGSRACAMQYVAGRVLALLPQVSVTPWETWFGHLAATVGPVSGGVSAAYSGEAGIEHAQDEAVSALQLGERLRGPGYLTAYGDVFPLDYATYLVQDHRLRGIYDNVVSRLASVAQPDRGELLGTLDAYLATGCAPGATATSLGIHRNTVLYRIRRILELTELHLEDAEQRFLVQLALRAYYRLARVSSPA
jgi:hypothetical protein